MVPEGSLPHSQAYATRLYPGPAQSSPYTSHLLEIQPNIIHPSTPRSPQWSPSLRFPQQDPIHPPIEKNIFATGKRGCVPTIKRNKIPWINGPNVHQTPQRILF